MAGPKPRDPDTNEFHKIEVSTAALHYKIDHENDESRELKNFLEDTDENGVPLHMFVPECGVIALVLKEYGKDTATIVTESIMETV